MTRCRKRRAQDRRHPMAYLAIRANESPATFLLAKAFCWQWPAEAIFANRNVATIPSLESLCNGPWARQLVDRTSGMRAGASAKSLETERARRSLRAKGWRVWTHPPSPQSAGASLNVFRSASVSLSVTLGVGCVGGPVGLRNPTREKLPEQDTAREAGIARRDRAAPSGLWRATAAWRPLPVCFPRG